MYRDILKKYSVFIKYVIFGAGTTVINIAAYFFLVHIFGDNLYQLWNVIAWILAVSYSFFVNEKFVFKKEYEDKYELIKGFYSFALSRVLSLILESGILFFGVTVMNYNDKFIKILAGVIVVIVNYFFGKRFVFK